MIRLTGVGHHALGLLGQLRLDGERRQLLGGDRLGTEAVEDAIGFLESLRLRRRVYAG